MLKTDVVPFCSSTDCITRFKKITSPNPYDIVSFQYSLLLHVTEVRDKDPADSGTPTLLAIIRLPLCRVSLNNYIALCLRDSRVQPGKRNEQARSATSSFQNFQISSFLRLHLHLPVLLLRSPKTLIHSPIQFFPKKP